MASTSPYSRTTVRESQKIYYTTMHSAKMHCCMTHDLFDFLITSGYEASALRINEISIRLIFLKIRCLIAIYAIVWDMLAFIILQYSKSVFFITKERIIPG